MERGALRRCTGGNEPLHDGHYSAGSDGGTRALRIVPTPDRLPDELVHALKRPVSTSKSPVICGRAPSDSSGSPAICPTARNGGLPKGGHHGLGRRARAIELGDVRVGFKDSIYNFSGNGLALSNDSLVDGVTSLCPASTGRSLRRPTSAPPRQRIASRQDGQHGVGRRGVVTNHV